MRWALISNISMDCRLLKFLLRALPAGVFALGFVSGEKL